MVYFISTQTSPTHPQLVGDLIVSNVYVDEITILTLESFPVQVSLVAKGTLADPCAVIDEITNYRDGNSFYVNITSSKPIDAVCNLTEKQFEEVIDLDVSNLKAGTYTVDVDGIIETFNLDVDNFIPEET